MSPTPDASNHRTKEENQERAFIAASRRKDRSLDARVESANRASALHKQRTGRALNISREIVESEAMYEEIDCNYQAKLQRMMHAQTLQLEQDFNRKLLDAMRTNPPGLQQRRASSLTPRGPLHGARKMSIDLSHLRPSVSEPMTSPLAVSSPPSGLPSSNVILSPASTMSPSYLGPRHAQVPSYVATTTSPAAAAAAAAAVTTPGTAPTWLAQQQLVQPWDGFYSNSLAVAGNRAMPMSVRQFRDRLASAPAIPVQSGTSSCIMAPPMTPATAASRGMNTQHIRVRSEPGPHTATQTATAFDPSSTATTTNSPPLTLDLSSSTELLPTPDLCPTPSTPISPRSNPATTTGSPSTSTSTTNISALDVGIANAPNPTTGTGPGTGAGPEKWTHTNPDFLNEIDVDFDFNLDLGPSPGPNPALGLGGGGPGVGLTSMFPRGPTDPDYVDFSQFASTLDSNHVEMNANLQMAMTPVQQQHHLQHQHGSGAEDLSGSGVEEFVCA